MLPSQYVRSGWTQNQNARDEFGKPVKPDAKNACSWDILGALMASHRSGTINLKQYDELKKLINNNTQTHFISWNDAKYRNQEEVISVLQQVEQCIGLM